ncbi:hypothetical protein Tco_0976513 [Tanacetum coccineum]|uniref:Uncharacterized protein n=1 Tax=Tanacetum coccineum TaxID=301880 RepID=A0ABQ5EHF1_9ASTR
MSVISFIDRLDHDAGPFPALFVTVSFWKILHPQVVGNIMKHGSDIFELPITELVQLVQAHQPVSLDLVLIDYALRIIVSSVWGKFCDAGFERLLPSDIQLLLVAFDSQLKVFHPLENQNASGEHLQCYVQII